MSIQQTLADAILRITNSSVLQKIADLLGIKTYTLGNRKIIYINPTKTPNPDLTAIKKAGYTDVFLKVSRVQDNNNYYATYLPKVKDTYSKAGLNLWAHINGNLDLNNKQFDLRTSAGQKVADEISLVCRNISNIGVRVHLDLDFGEKSKNTTLVKNFVQKCTSVSTSLFTIAVMPDAPGVDSSKAYGQDYSLLAPLVMGIVPMLYRYNYKITAEKMGAAAKSMFARFPDKLVIAVQNYKSKSGGNPDEDPVWLSDAELQADINAIKSYSKGYAVFRYNTTTSSNTTPTPAPAKPVIPTTPPTSTCLSDALKKGCKGDNIKALQKQLNTILGSSLIEDGDFGDATETVVKKFQELAGLLPDGIVGPVTRKRLDTWTTTPTTKINGAKFQKLFGIPAPKTPQALYTWDGDHIIWEDYNNDQKSNQNIENQIINNKIAYANCTDQAQFNKPLLEEMDSIEEVQFQNGNVKCSDGQWYGHIWLRYRLKGSTEWKNFDSVSITEKGLERPLGQLCCLGGTSNVSTNDAWLFTRDQTL